MMGTKTYTIYDVIDAEYMLEPLRCIHCGRVGEVTYYQYIGDGLCEYCGKWQLEDGEERVESEDEHGISNAQKK